MIKVTRLNGKEFIINSELIQTVEETPDCVITMRGGDKYIVTEKAADIVRMSVDHGRSLRVGL